MVGGASIEQIRCLSNVMRMRCVCGVYWLWVVLLSLGAPRRHVPGLAGPLSLPASSLAHPGPLGHSKPPHIAAIQLSCTSLSALGCSYPRPADALRGEATVASPWSHIDAAPAAFHGEAAASTHGCPAHLDQCIAVAGSSSIPAGAQPRLGPQQQCACEAARPRRLC